MSELSANLQSITQLSKVCGEAGRLALASFKLFLGFVRFELQEDSCFPVAVVIGIFPRI